MLVLVLLLALVLVLLAKMYCTIRSIPRKL